MGMVPIDRQGKELLCLIRAGATWFESVRLDNGWGVEDTETMSLFHETYHLLTTAHEYHFYFNVRSGVPGGEKWV